MSGEKNAYRLVVGKPQVKRPLERRKHECVDNIKTDIGETGWNGME
jgi:hypothetical protein